jgi:hypothetical protein
MRMRPDKSLDILEMRFGMNPAADAGEEECYVHARTSQVFAG